MGKLGAEPGQVEGGPNFNLITRLQSNPSYRRLQGALIDINQRELRKQLTQFQEVEVIAVPRAQHAHSQSMSPHASPHDAPQLICNLSAMRSKMVPRCRRLRVSRTLLVL